MQLVLLSDLWSLDDPMEKVAKRTNKFRMRGASVMEKWKENEGFTWNLIFGKNLSKHWKYLSLWYHYFPMIKKWIKVYRILANKEQGIYSKNLLGVFWYSNKKVHNLLNSKGSESIFFFIPKYYVIIDYEKLMSRIPFFSE